MPNRNLVFVVDDDPGTLKGVKRLLREHGYDSVLFPSAEAFRNHGDFDAACCVILDINLNKESGIDLRHRLKAAGISLPVIYMTGNDNPAVRLAALASIRHMRPIGAGGLQKLRDTIVRLLREPDESVCAECVAAALGQAA